MKPFMLALCAAALLLISSCATAQAETQDVIIATPEIITVSPSVTDPNDVTVEDQGDYEKTARAWVEAWLKARRSLPADSPEYIDDSELENLGVCLTAKEGLPKAVVFWVVCSIQDERLIGNSDKNWGYEDGWNNGVYKEIELHMESDGKFHLIEMGEGGGLAATQYNTYDVADVPPYPISEWLAAVAVEDQGDYEETARAWINAWLEAQRSLPDDNEGHIEDYTVDSVEINMVAKEGLPKAMIFVAKYSVKPTLFYGQSLYWMAGNGLAPIPERDESWGQKTYLEVELRMESNGKFHYFAMGTGGGFQSSKYIEYDWVGDNTGSTIE